MAKKKAKTQEFEVTWKKKEKSPPITDAEIQCGIYQLDLKEAFEDIHELTQRLKNFRIYLSLMSGLVIGTYLFLFL